MFQKSMDPFEKYCNSYQTPSLTGSASKTPERCMLKRYSYLDSRWSFQTVAVSADWCIVGWMVILVSDTVPPLRFCSCGMLGWILHPHPVSLRQMEFCFLLSLMVLLYRPHQTIQLLLKTKDSLWVLSEQWCWGTRNLLEE